MDSITHIVLGAAIGEAVAGRTLGKRAMLIGAIAQSLPDIDFITSFGWDTSRDLLSHRGFTHSFSFVVLAAVLLTWGVKRWFNKEGQGLGSALSFRGWTLFIGLQLFVHIFLDAFNVYGTGWFEPFSHYRVSFRTLFVADPFFSLFPGMAFLALLVLPKHSRARKYWIRLALIIPCLYLSYGVVNKSRIDARVEGELARQGISYNRYFSTPTPLNEWLWYIVAESHDGYYIGYGSVFDRRPELSFRFIPRNDSLLWPVRDRSDLRRLLRFSQGYYAIDRWEGALVFNDLRFGEIRGWDDPHARSVLHYFLERPENNAAVVQRGRFAGWNAASLKAFIKRIRGD
ncbi:MAG: metal-dependent hydrolase [Bacteroidota bacterium]|nr:metal-dependent hydrolase [Bacteroidota bacterium]MDP4214766.1 metal-dependent hydrolase [Bacteroidota bacterium]MDP4245666.1 metal-dependent hydrolase [Bacteroidota bacterium]MDP4256855.1 metal-dependent hydrolase [Bacteroidota bacterium]